jgi:hypothetical protein
LIPLLASESSSIIMASARDGEEDLRSSDFASSGKSVFGVRFVKLTEAGGSEVSSFVYRRGKEISLRIKKNVK